MKQPANWIPDRKVLAGGLAAVVAWFGVIALRQWGGVEISPDEASSIVGAVAIVAAYLVPDSVKDVARKVDRFLRSDLMAVAAQVAKTQLESAAQSDEEKKPE